MPPGYRGAMGDPYRWIAEVYDLAVEPFQRKIREVGMALYPPRPGMEVLDVGCGTGSHLARYREAGCVVHGLDLSPAMLAKAAARLGDDADLRLGDAAALPWPDGSFDLVVAQTVLHELDATSGKAAMAEMRRVVRDDGKVLVVDHRPDAPRGARAVANVVEFLAGIRHFRAYRAFLAAGGLPALVADAPFTPAREKVVARGAMSVVLLSPT